MADEERVDAEAREDALRARMQELKEARDAVVLAHFYVAPEVQATRSTWQNSPRPCHSAPSCSAAWSSWARVPSY